MYVCMLASILELLFQIPSKKRLEKRGKKEKE
jgi:hypothetical protein